MLIAMPRIPLEPPMELHSCDKEAALAGVPHALPVAWPGLNLFEVWYDLMQYVLHT